jgi:putative transposase
MVPTSAAVSRALEIFDSIQRGENNRTLRLWKKRIRTGASVGKSAIESCIRKRAGNRDIKIAPEVKQLLDEYIEEKYAKGLIGISAAHAEYRKFVRSRSLIPYFVQRKTLLRHIARHDPEAIAFGQGGRRAANAAQSPSPIRTREIPATRPFARAPADHYLADEFVVILETNDYRFEAKPWISILVDSYSGAILAIWVSLRPPSRRTTAVLLRRCMREHGRLPESIVLDHGADFISNFLRFLLARYGVTVVWRPIAHGRYGSEVERTAGSIRTRFHSHRQGNTVMKTQARSVSKSHSPQARASSSLQDFLTDLLRYVELHNETSLGTKPFSPKLMLSRGLAKFSACGNRVSYDHRFVVETSVEPHEYSIDPARGIYNGVHHYWHPDLSLLAAQGKKAEVRDDPEDPNKVYAHVQGQWVTCSATGAIVPIVDSVAQLAASIQQLDVRALRQMAREAAEDRLLNENAAVESARALAKTQAPAVMPPIEVKPPRIPDMRTIDLPELAVTKWEYPDALG